MPQKKAVTPWEKEFARLERRRRAYQARHARPPESRLDRALEDKVPPKLREALNSAFVKAFDLVFQRGTGLLERTFDAEAARQQFEIDQFAAQLGVPADLIMVPSTGYLMEEVLPTFHGAYDDDQLYDLASQQLQTVRLIDVREDLKEGKENGQVCYRTDHHLTSYGNYLLYRSYQIAQGAPYLSRDAYEVASYDGFYGTTWSGSGYWGVAPDRLEVWDSGIQPTVTLIDGGMEPQVSDSLFFPSHLEEMDKYPVFLDGNHSLVTIHNPAAAGSGSVLVIRDSYAHCFSTFLAANYENVYLVDLRYYRQSLSQFVAEHPVDKVLYLYGVDNLVSDTNSAWLQ